MGQAPTINADISDLFFNTDHSNAKQYAPGKRGANGRKVFAGYNEGALLGNATAMLESLERLGVQVPTPEELVADFHART